MHLHSSPLFQPEVGVHTHNFRTNDKENMKNKPPPTTDNVRPCFTHYNLNKNNYYYTENRYNIQYNISEKNTSNE